MYRVVQTRRPPRNLYKASGSQWYILSQSFVEFLVSCLYSSQTPPVSPDLSQGRGQGHDAVSHQVHHARHMPEEKGGEGVRWAGAEECKVVAAVDTWARHAFIPDEFYFQVALLAVALEHLVSAVAALCCGCASRALLDCLPFEAPWRTGCSTRVPCSHSADKQDAAASGIRA